MRKRSLTRLVVALPLVAAVLVLAGSALGTSFSVTSTADSGPGTLRQAILDANANPGPDEIDIAPGTYAPTSALPDVTGDLSIVGGASSTTFLDGSGEHSAALTVDANTVFAMAGITVETSDEDGIDVDTGGSATLVRVVLTGNDGVGISSDSDLTITQSSVTENSDDGVFATGTLQLSGSTVSDNNGNGVDVQGASATLTGDTIDSSLADGVLAQGALSVSSSTVSNSGAKGIRAEEGATLSGDTVSGSTGVGVDLLDDSTITDSTVSGGHVLGVWSEDGTLDLTNSTVTGNFGGGVTGELGTTTTLVNDTIAGNRGGLGGIGATSEVNVENTIVAGNLPADCSADVENLGHDLESGTSCGFLSLDDFQNTDPVLGPLQDNGGPTFTEALDPSSPAVDAGNDTACPAFDERGTSRPQGAHCDIGAFELVQAGGAPVTADAGMSTVQAGPPSVPADGTTAATITVTLEDGSGNPVSGKTVTLSAGSGSSAIATVSGTTDGSGVATFSVTDGTAETVVYAAHDTTDAVDVTQTASVTFTASSPPPPTGVHVVNTPPVAAFTVASSRVPGALDVSTNGSSSDDPDGSIVSYAWAFGDGTTATGVTAGHVYAAAGVYTIQLTVTDNEGATGVAAQTVTVPVVPKGLAPAFTVTPLTGQAGVTHFRFDAASSLAPRGDRILSYTWAFGDAKTATGTTPTATHVYARKGVFTVVLMVADSLGATATATGQVVVTPGPQLTVAAPAAVNFGSLSPGEASPRVPAKVTVFASSAYALSLARTTFSAGDLPLSVALDGSAPAGAKRTFAGAVAVPVGSSRELGTGTRKTGAARSGDPWPFALILGPVGHVSAGVHSAVLTFTVTGL